MDQDLTKENNLQKALDRFKQIDGYINENLKSKRLWEYTFITKPSLVTEEGEEDNSNEQPLPQGNDTNQPDMANNNQVPSTDNNSLSMDNNMNMDNEIDSNQEMPMSVDNGDEEFETEEFEEIDTQQEGDEVIDVDDLTKSQEVTELKIDGVDDKMTKLMLILSKFSEALDANDKKIDSLKKEIEERIPTEQEKLNLRSMASSPYSQTTNDFWEKLTASNPKYNVISDNNVSTADEQKRFEITDDDVRDINPREVSKSFDDFNDEEDDNPIKLDRFLNF